MRSNVFRNIDMEAGTNGWRDPHVCAALKTAFGVVGSVLLAVAFLVTCVFVPCAAVAWNLAAACAFAGGVVLFPKLTIPLGLPEFDPLDERRMTRALSVISIVSAVIVYLMVSPDMEANQHVFVINFLIVLSAIVMFMAVAVGTAMTWCMAVIVRDEARNILAFLKTRTSEELKASVRRRLLPLAIMVTIGILTPMLALIDPVIRGAAAVLAVTIATWFVSPFDLPSGSGRCAQCCVALSAFAASSLCVLCGVNSVLSVPEGFIAGLVSVALVGVSGFAGGIVGVLVTRLALQFYAWNLSRCSGDIEIAREPM